MKYQHIFRTASLAVVIALSGCSSSDDEERVIAANQGAQTLYDDAKRQMDAGNFAGAAATLGALDSRYPFGPLSHQVQLDLIYSHYKSGKPDQALATIDRFIRLNPNHSDVDYAYYMRGLTNMESDNNLFQDLLNIDRSDRDPTRSREAFEDFRRLIETYPDSKYAADAQKRMLYIKNRLASYEIAIARFYMRREAYVAAANRGRYVLEHFPDTEHVQQALEIMVACYDQLDLTELKNNAIKTLKINYPDSDFIS
ncbi:outer membrane protein assembly factor BamD [Alteromonas oceanisediminis]|uniref:outer membrane protein assembly factor BamD n=1 Tax=Alteromonas oceanisediminis TaxID=2836180 RepID=UPI001BDAA161|nr:outer membrane protein assembly factor BamD [Alteromonas oceanisediminis]MBT0585836.1 outer membrane protein assembly factor BamD [Alteromonas oceanisediminis]